MSANRQSAASAGWVNPLDRLFPDRPPPLDPAAGELDAAAGGCAAVMVALRAPIAGRVQVRFSGDGPVPTWFRLRDVAVNGNMGRPGQPQATVSRAHLQHLVRRAPFRVHEVLEPADTLSAEPGVTGGFLALFEPPRDAVPGRHAFEVRLTGAGLDVTLAGSLTVHAAAWPESQRLGVTNWVALNRLLYPYPDVQLDSPRHWELIEQLLAWLRRGGQDTILLPYLRLYKQPLFSLIQPQWDADDALSFDFSRFDRYVELALRLGFTRLEGGHLGGKKRRGGISLDTQCPHLYADIPTPRGIRQARFDSPRARRFLAPFLAAIREHLAGRGWSHLYVQHIADEPFQPVAESFVRACEWVRDQWPDVRLIDAASGCASGYALDIPVPESDFLDPYLPFYQRLARHKQVWFYTCCYPAVPWLNRFLDFPLAKGLLIPWLAYAYGLHGYLHWGANQWGRGNYADRGDSGDGWILFPGPDGPLPTLRWLALRLGIEDHELLCALGDTGHAAAARALAAELVTSNTVHVVDTATVTAVRRRLRCLAAAAAQSPSTNPSGVRSCTASA